MSRVRLVLIISFILALFAAAQAVRADDPPGAKLYTTYCGGCHGAQGSGGFGPAIGGDKYLNNNSDEVIARITGEGVAGKGMPAWSKSNGGSLADEQIEEIVRYLRSLGSATSSASTTSPSSTTTEPVTAAADYAQTKMAVTQSTNARGEVVVKATLKKNDDTGVSGVPIAFRRVTLYGSIDLGSVKTDNSGTATLTLNTLPDSGREVDADFKGNSRFGSSAGKIMLQPQVVESASASGNPNPYGVRLSLEDVPLLPPEGSLITPNPPLVPTAIFASVVLCVWATYGYVVSQVVGIRRSKPSRGRGDRFSRQPR